VYALLLELTALLCFWLCLGAWQEEGAASGRRTFVCLALAVFVWNVGVLARVEGVAPLEQVHRIAMLGAIPVAGLWVGLALMAADHPLLRRRRWLPLGLMAPQWLLYATLYMEGIGPYFLGVEDGRSVLGPAGWANAVYAWALGIWGSWLFLGSARRLRAHRGPRLLVVLASTAPVLASIATLVWDLQASDPTPLLLGAALLPLRFALFSGGWLHVLALPEHAIVSRLPRPLAFTDKDGVVSGLNPAAEALLSMESADALGRSLDAVLAEVAPGSARVRWPISVDDALAGYAVLLSAAPRSATGAGA
jgi:PAS domain-containing protein